MSEHAQSFIAYLTELAKHDRGALAHLRRSLGFAPGAYAPVYPAVERFVGRDQHANDPRRKALYLAAGLFSLHPEHRSGQSLATALGHLARVRESASIEQRFIALLGAEAEGLPNFLRQALSLLAADGHPCDYVRLLNDLGVWLRPNDAKGRDQVRQFWARDFYRAYDGVPDSTEHAPANLDSTQPAV